jgi:hypothetical protein
MLLLGMYIYELEGVQDGINYYHCRAARTKVSRAMNKYKEFFGEVDINSFASYFNSIRDEYQQRCRQAHEEKCSHSFFPKESCLKRNCTFPASAKEFDIPLGCMCTGCPRFQEE